jgi:hypothetical protein
MVVNINRLLREAFFATEVTNASEALEHATARFTEIYHRPGFSFEIVAPPTPDSDWVREHVVGTLLYHCQSTGVPVPACPGIFVSLFVGMGLHCISAYDVLTWAAHELRETPDDWLVRFGTHECDPTIR